MDMKAARCGADEGGNGYVYRYRTGNSSKKEAPGKGRKTRGNTCTDRGVSPAGGASMGPWAMPRITLITVIK